MNEELRARAREAVAKAMHAAERATDEFGWDDGAEAVRQRYLAAADPAADAALAVVADWCDEQRIRDCALADFVDGFNAALIGVYGACRPVGEGQT